MNEPALPGDPVSVTVKMRAQPERSPIGLDPDCGWFIARNAVPVVVGSAFEHSRVDRDALVGERGMFEPGSTFVRVTRRR